MDHHSKRGRPRSSAPAPELHEWREKTWPSAIPRAEYPEVTKDYKNLYLTIVSVLEVEGRSPPHWKSLEAAFAGRPAGSGTVAKIKFALRKIYPDFDPQLSEVPPEDMGPAPLSIEGKWEVMYIEDDRSEPLHITRERAFVRQDGPIVSGEYACLSYDRAHDFVLSGRIYGETVIGAYWVPGRKSAIGRGIFQLAATRQGEWLEGHCSWMDFDWMQVRGSICIWFRGDVPYSPKYETDAIYILEQEIERRTARIQ